MKSIKKLISVLLALSLLAAGIPAALADQATGVSAYASGRDSHSDKDIGEDIQVSADSATGVSSIGEDEGKAFVTVTKSVTASGIEKAEGLYAGATVSGKAGIQVDESVAAEGNNATGISGAAEVRGESTITVDQSVTVAGTEKAEGVKAEVHEDGKVTVTVHGSLEAKGNSASGISVLATEENSEAEITIDKEVTVDGQSGDVYGLNVSAASGSSVNISAGAVNAGAGPNSNSDPDQTEAMHIVTKDSGTEVTIRVSGDVVSGGDGIFVDDELGGDVDIIIDGTLSTEGIPVVTFGDTDHVSLAVWKIEGDNSEGSSGGTEGSSAGQAASDYASYAYYIIKSEQPKAGGSFKLDGTGKKDDFDVARFNEKVSLLVSLADGYQLNGAYNGDNVRVSLDKDEKGNYFLRVPMGGGVYLSVDISEIPSPTPQHSERQETRVADRGLVAEFASYSKADNSEAMSAVILGDDGQPVKSSIKVSFYGDSHFCIVINGGASRVRGFFQVVNGALTLALENGTLIPIGSDGTFTIVLENGTILVLHLADSLIQQLMKF